MRTAFAAAGGMSVTMDGIAEVKVLNGTAAASARVMSQGRGRRRSARASVAAAGPVGDYANPLRREKMQHMGIPSRREQEWASMMKRRLESTPFIPQ